ncbi:CGNR zinc finger domain-containing protein [Glutamicibacter arilaitensis]|uniref:CGNR zinc finger domain-containing protein n=1 Tax=Glutamicibacter arilaitensis TaxID=256701 RepID=UPI003FD103D7
MPLPPSSGAAQHCSIDLANSEIHLPGGKSFDALANPQGTTQWLIARGLVPQDAALQSYCQNRLVNLRSLIRSAFLASISGTPVGPVILQGINAALLAAPSTPLLHQEQGKGFFRAMEHPATQLTEHAMSRLAEDAAVLLSSEEAGLLAQCEAEPCNRYLLKTHGRRHWCSTRCGDRVRAARSYAKKKSRQDSPAS